MDIRETGSKATWHLHGLMVSKKSQKEMSCTLRLILINKISIWKESREIRVFMRIFPTRKHILRQKKQRLVLHYYKNPKLSKIKIRIIYLNSGTLDLWILSNLTFEGYLAGTVLILSVRSSSSLLCKFYL